MRIFLVSIVALAFVLNCNRVLAQVEVVGPRTATNLHDAVSRASSLDTIYVEPGTYEVETITITAPVAVVGIDYPVLKGKGGAELFLIESDSVIVSGFDIRDVGVSYVEDRAAIKVQESHHCRITDNRLSNNFFGIYLAKSANCLISGNTIVGSGGSESGTGNGIHLWYSKNVVISGNDISNHRDGIYLEFVEDSEVEGNESWGNRRYGLHFMFSDGNQYRRNRFYENSAGVAVMYTKNVVMEANSFEDNWGNASFGLLLKDITDSQVVGNQFKGNTVAVYAEASDRIVFERNLFKGNGWAIKIMANCYDNQFRYNNIESNTFDVATNSRSTSVVFSNNYWSQYDGYDLDRDGIGDVPHRPVRLFSLVVENNESALFLLRSFLVTLVDAAEQVVPSLTPTEIVDLAPMIDRVGLDG